MTPIDGYRNSGGLSTDGTMVLGNSGRETENHAHYFIWEGIGAFEDRATCGTYGNYIWAAGHSGLMF